MSKANNFQRMRELGFYQQAAVAATLLERMIPNYQLFAEVTETGDGALVRHSLDMVWEWLQVKRAKINFERIQEELELVTPEVTNFDMFGVYPAVDAITALDMMLNGIREQDSAEFIHVAKISQASVARLIEHQTEEAEVTSEAELKKIVRDHELMQYEMDCLADLLEICSQIKEFGRDEIKALKQWVMDQGVTNLGMEL
ncbi:MAG TPA: DUF416 domain-containing protein [Rheinheimera sp.]|nr:DUF416 domain-containing protein [Rheinheimera sp.]